jgi:neutral ceramidase
VILQKPLDKEVTPMIQAQLQVGVGQTDITPPIETEMSGFIAREGKSRGVHDPLWAKALVISDGHIKLAIVIADLIGVDAEIIKAVRTQIGPSTAILPENVIVGATHTHSGPVSLSRGYLGRVDPAYRETLSQNMVKAIVLADQNLGPVELWVGESNCPEVGKNRRKPGGTTDPQVLTVCFENAAGVKAVLVNYACHPVVLGPANLEISADYPFYLREALEGFYPGAQIFFINGACGDINTGHSARASIDGTSVRSERTFAEAERLGKILAEYALMALKNAVKQAGRSIKIGRKVLDIVLEPLPSVSRYEDYIAFWDKRRRELEQTGGSFGEIQTARTMSLWAEQMRDLRRAGNLAAAIPVEIAAFSVGALEFAAFPGEFLHQLGLKLKKARAPKQVMVMGYSNGNLGYVADAPAYNEGGYEVEESYPFYGLPSKLARGGGERIVEALQDILAELGKRC